MLFLHGLFWVAVALFVYPYLVFPLFLRLLSAGRTHGDPPAAPDEDLPSVTVIISAYNEEQVIGEKIRNTLHLDYPGDKVDVIVVSDASADGTDEIVRGWAREDPRVRLLRQDERGGKSVGLNGAVRASSAEVVIFSDANAIYDRQALRFLVKAFADAQVGYVVGAALYNQSQGSEAEQSESLYWRLELWLKERESRYCSVVGGDGAIYAVRRRLFWELLDDDISDFVNPLQVVAHGFRGRFEPRAVCYEDSAEDFSKEFQRKRRIVNRSWRAVRRNIAAFNIREHGAFLFLLFSHKIVRWYSVVFLALALACGSVLATVSPDYVSGSVTAGLWGILVLGALGYLMEKTGMALPRLVYIPYYFLLVNVAAVLGIIDDARGVRYAVWTHVRSS